VTAADRVARGVVEDAPPARSTEGRLVYAIGDVHGRYDLLTDLLEAIVTDIAAAPAEADPLLVLCGDYIDRGPSSGDVLAALVWLSRRATIEVRCLRGNHEAALLDFVERPEALPDWLAIGGETTLHGYGLDPEDEPAALRDALLDRMPASHLALLRAMPTWTTCGGYVFVHAGLRPGVALEAQDDRDRLSIGAPLRDADARFDKLVVHGHGGTAPEAEIRRHRIGIDTGAWRTGTLTALRLDGETTALLQTQAAGSRMMPRPTRDEDAGPMTMRDVLEKLRPDY
jgi:serine/threonine protein phosphatase 1